MDRASRFSSEKQEAEEEGADDDDEDEEEEDEEEDDDDEDSTSPLNTARTVDGPEVKPLRTSRSRCGEIDGYRNEHQAIIGDPTIPMSSGTNGDDALAGGRLRFFFAGRCVLELAHDTDGRGRPKQWTQTATAGTSPRPTTWVPSTSIAGAAAAAVIQSDKVERVSPSPTSSSSSPEETAKMAENDEPLGRRGSFLPFTVLRRFLHSSPESCSRPSGTVFIGPALRRAARRPFCLFRAPIAAEENSVEKSRVVRRRNRSLTQKSRRLDGLTHALLERCMAMNASVRHIGERSADCTNVRWTPPRESSAISSPPSMGTVAYTGLPELQCSTEQDLERKSIAAIEVSVSNAINAHFEQKEVSIKCGKRDVSFPVSPARRRRRRQRQLCQVEEAKSVSVWNRDQIRGGKEETPPPLNHVTSPQPPPAPLPPRNPPFVPPSQRPSQRRGARGRTIGEAVRNFVIREILDLGGDPRTKYVPRGVFTEVGLRHKVDATTTYRWWLKYCNGLRAALEHNDPSVPERLPFSHLEQRQHVTDGDSRAPISTEVGDQGRTRVGVPSSSVGDGRPEIFNGGERKYVSPSLMMNPAVATTSLDEHEMRPVTDSALHKASITATGIKNAYWPLMSPLPPLTTSPSLPFHQQHHRRRHHHRRARFSNDPTAASAMSVTSSDRCHPTTLPVGVCLPYVWNVATTSSSVVDKLHGRAVYSALGNKTTATTDDHVLDEPLDLTLPKKKLRSTDSGESPSSPFKPIVGDSGGERLHVTI